MSVVEKSVLANVAKAVLQSGVKPTSVDSDPSLSVVGYSDFQVFFKDSKGKKLFYGLSFVYADRELSVNHKGEVRIEQGKDALLVSKPVLIDVIEKYLLGRIEWTKNL